MVQINNHKSIADILKDNKRNTTGIIKDLIARRQLLVYRMSYNEDIKWLLNLYDGPINRSCYEQLEFVQYSNENRTLFLRDAEYIGNGPRCKDEKFKHYEKRITLKKETPLYELSDRLIFTCAEF